MAILGFAFKRRRKNLLLSSQYKTLSEFFREVSQAIFLGISAAYFLPPAIGLDKATSTVNFIRGLLWSLTGLLISVIFSGKGGKK